jgi:hypothetical protein
LFPYANWEGGQASLTPLIGYDKSGVGDYYLIPKSRGKETMVEPYLYPIEEALIVLRQRRIGQADGKQGGQDQNDPGSGLQFEKTLEYIAHI